MRTRLPFHQLILCAFALALRVSDPLRAADAKPNVLFFLVNDTKFADVKAELSKLAKRHVHAN